MHRALRPMFASLALVVSLARCSGCARVCASDVDCAVGTVCEGGACVGGAPPPTPTRLAITAVDGDGSARAPSGDAPVDDAAPAAHRLRENLIVRGALLDTVTSATLGEVALEIASVSDDGETMTLKLPASSAAAGLLLTLALASASEEASAQVFLLQGEPGPSSLVEPRVAATCASEGVGLAFGVDTDGDGALSADEETATRDLCGGGSSGDPPLFACAAGTCTTTNTLVAPAIEVAGRPVLTHVDAPAIVLVPGDAPTVNDALALFDGLRLDADVTITVVGDHTEPFPVTISHADSRRIRIAGAAGGILRFVNNTGIVVDGAQLGGVLSIVLQGNDNAGTHGISARRGARVNIAADVVVRDFGIGVFADANSVVIADGVESLSNVVGFFASSGAHIQATGAVARQNGNGAGGAGFASDFGANIVATSCTSEANDRGFTVTHGATLLAQACTIRTNTFEGILVAEMGFAFAPGSNLGANNANDVHTVVNSVTQCAGCAIQDQAADATSVNIF